MATLLDCREEVHAGGQGMGRRGYYRETCAIPRPKVNIEAKQEHPVLMIRKQKQVREGRETQQEEGRKKQVFQKDKKMASREAKKTHN